MRFARVTPTMVVAISVVIALVVLALYDGAFRSGLDKTASLASWAVAAGTLVLAIATFELARRARDEAEAVRREATEVGAQVELQREQLAASSRPYVYPSAPADWAVGDREWAGRHHNALPLKNGGPGLALNVRGVVVWNLSPGSWRRLAILGSSIAPGDDVAARLQEPASTGWVGARGFVRYEDLSGDEWVTFFKFDLGPGNQLSAEHAPPRRLHADENPDSLDEAHIAAEARGGGG